MKNEKQQNKCEFVEEKKIVSTFMLTLDPSYIFLTLSYNTWVKNGI